MKTMLELYRSYNDTRKKNIRSHYDKYANHNRENGNSFVSFNEWIDSYNDLRNIFSLMSQTEVYETRSTFDTK